MDFSNYLKEHAETTSRILGAESFTIEPTETDAAIITFHQTDASDLKQTFKVSRNEAFNFNNGHTIQWV